MLFDKILYYLILVDKIKHEFINYYIILVDKKLFYKIWQVGKILGKFADRN